MDLGLTGKKMLVTGASRGIGAAIAKAFLEEGGSVCLVSRGSVQLYDTHTELVAEYGEERAIADTCDCTDHESLLALKQRIAQRWGEIDIVIANIGVACQMPFQILISGKRLGATTLNLHCSQPEHSCHCYKNQRGVCCLSLLSLQWKHLVHL